MPFVQGNCTNCGGTLAVDNEKDAWICPYCNTPFIVEKAINNFNITNNITAQTVNIYGGPEKEFEIAGGTLKQYKGEATDVIVPDNVTTISYSAFHETNITSIQLPEGIREVYLSSCKYLKEIKLPQSVVNLGLLNCSSVQNVELHEGLQFVFFEGCSSIENLKIPNTIKKIKKGTFKNCHSLKVLMLPETLVVLEDDFYGCNSLIVLNLPPQISSIKLSSMKNLKCISFPSKQSILEIDNLPSLQRIEISDVKTIIKGLTGKELIIFNQQEIPSSLIIQMISKKEIIIPEGNGTLELYFALINRCSNCGNEFSMFGKCKKCDKKRSYAFTSDLCPQCLIRTCADLSKENRKTPFKCRKCGQSFNRKDLKTLINIMK